MTGSAAAAGVTGERRRRSRLLVTGVLLVALPAAAAGAAGLWWTARSGLSAWFALSTAVAWTAGWALLARATAPSARATAEERAAGAASDGAEAFWSDHDLAVWAEVRRTADSVARGERTLSGPEDAEGIFRELLAAVAAAYHPLSAAPVREVKPADLLVTAERAARELRERFVDRVPFLHAVTLRELGVIRRRFAAAERAYDAYRVVRAVADPIAAAVYELRGAVSGASPRNVSENAVRRSAEALVLLSGRHLINLYSGHAFTAAGGAAESAPGVRVLVVGPPGSGRSRLVAALSAAPGPEGRPPLVFSEAARGEDPEDTVRALGGSADVVVVVTPAPDGGRAAEAAVAARLKAAGVPVVAAVTMSDLLSPASEWDPPYLPPAAEKDPARSAKSAATTSAAAYVAEVFGLPEEDVVAVSLRETKAAGLGPLLARVRAAADAAGGRRAARRAAAEFREDKRWRDMKRSAKRTAASALDHAVRLLTRDS